MIEGFQRLKRNRWVRPKGYLGPRPGSSYRGARRNAARGTRKARRSIAREMKNFPATVEDHVDAA